MKRIETKQEVGAYGEKIACRYLRLHGYTVKERNWRTGHLELDIIATSFRHIAFVEVKTRTYRPQELKTALPPGAAVNADKQRATRQAAGRYLYEHPTRKTPRMDVIEIWLVKKTPDSRPRVAKLCYFKGAY